jgi:hypothetical protein
MQASAATSQMHNQKDGIEKLRRRICSAIGRRLLSTPVNARHSEYSILYSEDDSVSRPSQRLLNVGIESVRSACTIDLSDIARRVQGRLSYPDNTVNLWPGEHYRLLAGLVSVLRPKLVIEIGTAQGLSALSFLKYLPEQGKVVTFDLVPWREYPNTCLEQDDFDSGRLAQIIGNLGEPEFFSQHRELLRKADIIFEDATHDGIFEEQLVRNVETIQFDKPPIFIFDDVRVWNMLGFWRDLRWPKLDFTSFGHWTGTGLCEPVKPDVQ